LFSCLLNLHTGGHFHDLCLQGFGSTNAVSTKNRLHPWNFCLSFPTVSPPDTARQNTGHKTLPVALNRLAKFCDLRFRSTVSGGGFVTGENKRDFKITHSSSSHSARLRRLPRTHRNKCCRCARVPTFHRVALPFVSLCLWLKPTAAHTPFMLHGGFKAAKHMLHFTSICPCLLVVHNQF
jgi:hypothetical protein